MSFKSMSTLAITGTAEMLIAGNKQAEY